MRREAVSGSFVGVPGEVLAGEVLAGEMAERMEREEEGVASTGMVVHERTAMVAREKAITVPGGGLWRSVKRRGRVGLSELT